MAKYEIDSIDSAFTHEWALECAYSVNGRILSTRPGRVVLEVESDPAVTGYLESLLDQDEAVSRYREID